MANIRTAHRQGPVNNEPAHAAPALAPGTVLENRYEIKEVIGRGGMSTVYAARDLRFSQVERMCAIKEMVDEDPDPGTRALRLVNFEREAALLATISHQSVPRIYDYFSHDGLVYLVLEYIDGQDLDRLLAARRKPYPEREVLNWALEICSVLHMLHTHDPDPIIFRDLKPSNIMLSSTGRIMLIDFGIARMFQGIQRGTMIGTEGYAPPEQYRGVADARGDIYALGATLHHLLTNSDPRHETPFTFHERPIQSQNPDVSDLFATAIGKMVMYHPDQRYQSVAELERALQTVAQSLDGPAPAAGDLPAIQPAPPEIQTQVFSGPIAQLSHNLVRTRASRKRLRRRNAREPSIERIAWTVQTGDEVRGSAVWTGSAALIGSYDRCVYSIGASDGVVHWKFPTGKGVVSRPAVSNQLMVVGSEDSSVYGVDTADGGSRWETRTSAPVRSSPSIIDDVAFVGSDDASIYAMDCESGDVLWRKRVWGAVRSSPVACPDDPSRLYVGSDDGSVYALETATGEAIWTTPAVGPVQSIPFLSNDKVYVSSKRGMVSAIAAHDGSRIWQTALGSAIVSSPVVRDGVVLLGLTDGALVGLSAEDGSEIWRIRFANQISSTPLAGAQTGYIGTVDGDCLAFDVGSGELSWKHAMGGPIVSSPVFAGQVLVVGSLDGKVYGVRLTEPEVDDLEKGGSS